MPLAPQATFPDRHHIGLSYMHYLSAEETIQNYLVRTNFGHQKADVLFLGQGGLRHQSLAATKTISPFKESESHI